MKIINCPNCGSANQEGSEYCSHCGQKQTKIETISLDDKITQLTQRKKVKPNNIKKILNKFWIGLILIVIYFGFKLSEKMLNPITYTKTPSPSLDKVLMAAASELNKTSPIMIDKDTRFDNAIALPGNTFEYNYTLVNINKSEIEIDTFKIKIQPQLINNVRTSPNLKTLRDNNVTIVYYYSDKNGVFILKFPVTPDMYK